MVGRPSVHNWVQYHAETGGYNVTLERDEWSVADPNRPRKVYRFQLQGPNAPALLEKLNGGPLPPTKFFHMTWITIAGRKVRFLHHGMAGVAGGELFGPFEEGPEVIEDYYLTPWDLGYGHILKFDHEFIGREALEAKAKEPHRRKVTLVWNPEDVARVHLQRDRDGLLGHRGRGLQRAGHGGHPGVGGAQRRVPQAKRGAARADGDPGHRSPCTLRGVRPSVPGDGRPPVRPWGLSPSPSRGPSCQAGSYDG